MKIAELEIYSEASNHAVVKPPGRQFPGIVVQGDSLAMLGAEAKELSERLKQLHIHDEELLCLAQGLQEQLLERQLHYQQVLAQHGVALPYSEPAKASDLVVLVPEGHNVP
ncbi:MULTISPECIES: DUF6959 family protein [Diaphorobacter]|uniref:DUF6959 family protein n=2 Tax=Comamonadaceae TaxID=80864 RepID=UPI0011E4CFCE|nr:MULTISPECIES: hypothetical protein [Diaphorobacter]